MVKQDNTKLYLCHDYLKVFNVEEIHVEVGERGQLVLRHNPQSIEHLPENNVSYGHGKGGRQ